MTSAISSPIKLSRRAKALLLSPLVLLIGAATRLIIVSNGDTTVATSIAAAGGVTGSLLGSVIPLLPPYLPLLVLIFVLYRRLVLASVLAAAAVLVSPAYGDAATGWTFAFSSIPTLFEHALNGEWSSLEAEAPGIIACVALGVGFAFWGVAEIAPRETSGFLIAWEQFRFVAFGLACGAICVFGLLFMHSVYRVPFDPVYAAQIARRPWLPGEEIIVDSGEKYVGYVISNTEGWLLLMNESDRALEYLPADSVVDRRVCTPQSYDLAYEAPLVELPGAGAPSGKVCSLPKHE